MNVRRAVLLLLGAAAGASAQTAPVDQARWLAGCWEQRAGTRVTIEMWMAPFGGAMLGASRTVIEGRMREFEYLRLTARGDTLVYTASPSGQTTTDFRATMVSAEQLTFENRAHDFPQVISYRRTGADSIVARIEGPGPNSSTRGIDFPMRRVSCQDLPSPTPPPDTLVIDAAAARDGRLLIVKGASGNWDVYLTNADASGIVRLTEDAAVDYQPAWSPDDSRIAFVSVRDGHQEIHVMRPDGSALTRLTHGDAHNSEPAWSPRGDVIAFRSEREGRPQIYLMNADASDQRRITSESTGAISPSWSPDGRRLLYASPREHHAEIHVMNIDGSASSQLTRTPQGHSGAPSWSPDGNTILFWSSRDGNDEVYLMNSDGSTVRNLTNHPARDLPLGWTPDGRYVLFRSTRDRAGGDVYRMRPDGSEVTRLTTSR